MNDPNPDYCGAVASWESITTALLRFIKTYDVIELVEWMKAHGLKVASEGNPYEDNRITPEEE